MSTLERAAGYARCPACHGPVRVAGTALRCERGHSFNIARQGYVSLLSGRAGPGTGDSTDMVMARDRFLGGGHYQPLAAALAELAARHERGGPGLVIDLAGGTGYYLREVLDALPDRLGVCLELSAPALRRAARAHRRAVAFGADVWRPFPLAAGSAVLVMSVFGPRNAAEIRRVLVPGGTLLIATPGQAHLAELRAPLGIIGIDERKTERLCDAFGDYQQSSVLPLSYRLSLGHSDISALVAMGPSARHIAPEVMAGRIAALPSPVTVSADFEVRAYRARH